MSATGARLAAALGDRYRIEREVGGGVPIPGGEPERLTTDPSDDFFPSLSPARCNMAADAERLHSGIGERRGDVWVMEVEEVRDR